MRTKTCVRCNQTFPSTPQHFSDNLRTFDRLQPHCRVCGRVIAAERRKIKNERSKAWYHANKEKARESYRNLMERNPNDRKEYMRRYREENRERIKAYNRERRAKQRAAANESMSP